MTNVSQNAINGLLIEPDPIQYSFDTPGWNMIGILLILIVLFWGILMYIRYRQNAYRREAMTQLINIANSAFALQEKVTTINRILKQVAMHIDNREAVAALTFDNWFAFLSKTCKSPCFDEHLFGTIQKGQFDTEQLTEKKVNSYLHQSVQWIKTHHHQRS